MTLMEYVRLGNREENELSLGSVAWGGHRVHRVLLVGGRRIQLRLADSYTPLVSPVNPVCLQRGYGLPEAHGLVGRTRTHEDDHEDDDESLRETEYLLASPANAAILREASSSHESDIELSLDEIWARFDVPKE